MNRNIVMSGGVAVMGGDVAFYTASEAERNVSGWKCEQQPTILRGHFIPVLSELYIPGEPRMSSEEMLLHARGQGSITGLRDAEGMAREQDKISKGARGFILVFSQVWEDTNGCRGMFCLTYRTYRWCLDFGSLKDDFCPNHKLVRLLEFP